MKEITKQFQEIYSDLLSIDRQTVADGLTVIIRKDGKYKLIGFCGSYGWQHHLVVSYFALLHRRGLLTTWGDCKAICGKVEQVLFELYVHLVEQADVCMVAVSFGFSGIFFTARFESGNVFECNMDELTEQAWTEHLQRLMAG